MKRLPLVLTCTLLSTSIHADADFTYRERVQITGGTVVTMMKFAGVFSRQARKAGEPILSTVMVKGNRMVRIDQDQTEMIDLDAGTVTMIDHAKRQYTTVTFEQMRKQMEAAAARARAEQAKEQHQAPPQTSGADSPKIDVKFKVKVRSTGASKEVAGLSSKESILTMNMDATDQKSGQAGSLAITNDMYLAPEIPGYEEVREFDKRYAIKMGTVVRAAINDQMIAMMQQPAVAQGMADMIQEMSKLKGIPVLQIMRIGTTINGMPLPAASEVLLPVGPPPPTVGSVAKAAVMSSLPFGGFGKKKKQEEEPPMAIDSAAGVVLMESTTQYTDLSRASVDASQFAVPSGYRMVEPKQLD